MNTKKAVISIAMATYNGQKFLTQQIDSILNQSYKNLELIICDDISTDKTIEIIEGYIKKYDFIKLYKNEINLGFVKNFEKAIGLCSGKYIALSDQDDIWELNKLELYINEIQKIEKENIDLPVMIHSDLITIDSMSKVIEKSYFEFRNYNFKAKKSIGTMLGPCGVMGNTILFNKELKKYILPFPDNLAFHDYWIAVVNELLGKRITLYDKLVMYRVHETNSSNSEKNISRKKSLVNSIKTVLTRDFTLPYKTTIRKETIKELLKRFNLLKEDRKIVEIFVKYLSSNLNKLHAIYFMIKYNYIKTGLKYRLSVFLKVLLIKKSS